MPDKECIDHLGGWTGYRVTTVTRFEKGVKGPRPQVWIELVPRSDRKMICNRCGKVCASMHDMFERWARDLPVFDADTHLLVHRCRVVCPRCGPTLERLPWLDRHARVTQRLASSVACLCAQLPIKHTAEFYDLGWDAVKAIHKAYLERILGEPDLDGLTVLAMDEFALAKGHRYATVIIDPITKRVLFVGKGRDRASVRPFFEMLGPERCSKIKAVAMDMHSAYEQEVKANCPQAQIVFDLFHVVAKYGREVIDRVRIDEASRVAHDAPARRVIKSARWLLLRNRSNIKQRRDRVRLNELLKANRRLMTVYGISEQPVGWASRPPCLKPNRHCWLLRPGCSEIPYVLRDELKHLWWFRSRGHAHRHWRQWYSHAVRSRIEPLRRFAMRLKAYLHGILSHCAFPLHTSLLEGINNKIKVIKRMAYGFRDDDYFFLRIRAAFPGVGHEKAG